MTRNEIIAEAREWEGTRWEHQKAMKGVACDCIGLIRGVYKELTGLEMPDVIDYPQTAFFYCRDERLYPELQKYLPEITVAEAQPGDILTFGMRTHFPDHHLGILLDGGLFIHACGDAGIQKTIITSFDALWQARARHAFTFPGVS